VDEQASRLETGLAGQPRDAHKAGLLLAAVHGLLGVVSVTSPIPRRGKTGSQRDTNGSRPITRVASGHPSTPTESEPEP
jgi:hypothetical protein